MTSVAVYVMDTGSYMNNRLKTNRILIEIFVKMWSVFILVSVFFYYFIMQWKFEISEDGSDMPVAPSQR